MSTTNITYGTPIKIVTTLSDLADRNGKTINDVTDVLYLLKKNRDEPDANAAFSDSVKAGSIAIDTVNSTFEVNITGNDYGFDKIKKGHTYLICIGVEFNDSTFYIEDYDPQAQRKLSVLRDKIRA